MNRVLFPMNMLIVSFKLVYLTANMRFVEIAPHNH